MLAVVKGAGVVVCVKRWRAHLAVVVVVVVAFVLAGCKIDGMVELRADGSTKIDLTFEDSRDSMAKIHQTCEGVRLTFEAELTFVRKPKVEDVTPKGGHLTCRLTSNEPFGGHVRFIREGDRYSFEYPGDNADDKEDYSDFPTHITIIMPEKIVKVNRGAVDDNKVVIDSLDFLTYGVSIVAEKHGGVSPSGEGKGVMGSSGGVPVWVWAGVAGGVLVVVGGVVALRRRKHRAVPVSSNLGPAGFGPTAGLDGPPGTGSVSGVVWPESGRDGASQADAGAAGQELDEDLHSRYRPR